MAIPYRCDGAVDGLTLAFAEEEVEVVPPGGICDEGLEGGEW